MRPAVWRFGALAIVCACGARPPAQSAIDNHAAGRAIAGAYWCTIESDDVHYPKFPCAIRPIEGRLVLAKLGGSQRFRGEVQPRGAGFTFDGELYCPYGDCSQPLHGTFVWDEKDWRGTFSDAKMIVRMVPVADSAFGGVAYGGDGYGDPYGAQGYGSASDASNSEP